ncbi:alpha/beta hydrolase family protein [Geodermatophilus aquaeductus]|nr:alpha/beta hydrolase [Geodermatophilus aquaeductus]
MGVRKRGSALLVSTLLVLATGCSSDSGSGQPGASSTTSEPAGLDVTSTTVSFSDLSRTTDGGDGSGPVPGRELDTTIWYPTEGDGPFPLVVFSHGYKASPEDYAELIEFWAARGMVVAAPRFPLTATGTPEIRTDLPQQPGDVSFVLDQVLDLARTQGSEIEGLIDPERIAAAGHSAGGLTSALLVSDCCFDDRIDAVTVLASGPLDYLVPELGVEQPSAYVSPGVPMLFVHGGADDAIPVEQAQVLYQYAPNGKAFVLAPFATHSDPYGDPADDSWQVIAGSSAGFLEWALQVDSDGLTQMRSAVEADGAASFLDDELP